MALWIDNKRVAHLYIGNKAIAALYQGAVKIWEAVSSCFGSGFWRDNLPWKDTDAWKY